jgi:hypothetical protein
MAEQVIHVCVQRPQTGRVTGATTVSRFCMRRATFPGIRRLRYVRLPVCCIRKISVPGSRTNSLRIDSGDMFQRKASSFTE